MTTIDEFRCISARTPLPESSVLIPGTSAARYAGDAARARAFREGIIARVVVPPGTDSSAVEPLISLLTSVLTARPTVRTVRSHSASGRLRAAVSVGSLRLGDVMVAWGAGLLVSVLAIVIGVWCYFRPDKNGRTTALPLIYAGIIVVIWIIYLLGWT